MLLVELLLQGLAVKSRVTFNWKGIILQVYIYLKKTNSLSEFSLIIFIKALNMFAILSVPK